MRATLLLLLLALSSASQVPGLQTRLRGGQECSRPAQEKVCLVGSGNWGCAIARIVGANVVATRPDDDTKFDKEVRIFEEEIDGEKLTEIINTKHENVKYLPGFSLPENVVAVPDLATAVKDATILIFVLPHQFLGRLLPTIKANLHDQAIAVSLIKGMDCGPNGLELISDKIREGLDGVDTSVLMGANVADEVARGDFCEATIGYKVEAHGKVLQRLFDQPLFRCALAPDPNGVELCGALKNVVALAAGFADGLGMGGNTKAALMRIGLREMRRFGEEVLGGMRPETLLESCGVADLVTTCYGGRNRKCAAAFAKDGTPWEQLEQDLLGGQKLQGTLTARHLHQLLEQQGLSARFPFFEAVHDIVEGHAPPDQIVARAASYY